MTKENQQEENDPKPVRVLIVDDSEDDAMLVIRELKKGGYDPEYERVETSADMNKALQDKCWDVILCDYKMPKFSGTQAIAALKETNIDIPLIIVSGAIVEATAVECMRSGAHDYIMKGNLSRLVSAVKRELQEAESRSKRIQAEDELRRQLKELQRWHAVTLDREDRVRGLKKEVNDLLKEAGKPSKYDET